MKHITARTMIGFEDELQKHAGIGGLVAKHLGGRYGRQIALGAGVGGLGGAATAGEDENRVARAIRGAGVGATLGLGGVLAQKGGRQWAGTGIKNFGRRQLHSVTGKGVKDVEEARKIGLIPKKQAIQGPFKDPKALKRNLKLDELDRLNEHAFEKGYTSAPGVLHGLVTDPKDVLRTGWQRGGGFGKAFAGLGAYGSIKGAVEKPEPGGPGRLEKTLRGAGSTLGWVAAPHAMLGGSVIGEGIGALTGKAGKLVDKRVAQARQARQMQQMYSQYPYYRM